MSKKIKKTAHEALSHQGKKKAGEYVAGILRGDRILLSQAITLAESTRADHQVLAAEVLEKCLPLTGKSLRIGITGAPGVGKSTFIETFGSYLTAQGRRLAVLAIDPSSQVGKGSILGDKTRMGRLSSDENAFIRPSPASGALGGVAKNTRETILLCEAAGYDTVFVETVGVGQSEVTVHEMVDFFMLLLQPGGGDELQGIKRGIMEMADLLAVNKADGDNLALAHHTKTEYARALHLFPEKQSGWTAGTLACSALNGTGMEEIWNEILAFQKLTQANGWFQKNRREQLRNWLYEHIERALKKAFFENTAVRQAIGGIEARVVSAAISPASGAEALLALFKNR